MMRGRFLSLELWFVLAIAVVFLWGCDGILAKVSTPKLGVMRVAILMAVVSGTTYLLGFLCWRNNLRIGLEDAGLAGISCVVGAVAYLCFFESILDGQVATVGTISAGYPALTVLGAIFFLSETLKIFQLAAIGAIIGGVVGLSYEPNPSSEHSMPRRSLFFALLAFRTLGSLGINIQNGDQRGGCWEHLRILHHLIAHRAIHLCDLSIGKASRIWRHQTSTSCLDLWCGRACAQFLRCFRFLICSECGICIACGADYRSLPPCNGNTGCSVAAREIRSASHNPARPRHYRSHSAWDHELKFMQTSGGEKNLRPFITPRGAECQFGTDAGRGCWPYMYR